MISRQWLVRPVALIISAAALLSACGTSSAPDVGSNGGDPSGPTTTLGTRGSESQPNPAVTDNADATWANYNYSRKEDYPRVARLPLQFITLASAPNAGKKLAVLVSVPANADGSQATGPFPAILTQNAYRIDIGSLSSLALPFGATLGIGGTDDGMIKRGYVTVAVDIVGSGLSDGEEHLLDSGEQEGYAETVDWITQQSWSDGTIGVAGTSYLGISALLTAEQRNPAVKAAFVQVPMGDAWRDVIGTGGMLNGLFISTWLSLTQHLSVMDGYALLAYPQYTDQIIAATQEHVATINDFFIPLINNALDGDVGLDTDDGDFWSQRSPSEHASDIQVPTFIIGGTHDIFQRGEPLLYEQLKHNVLTKLMILPGDHVQIVANALLGSNQPGEDGPPPSPDLMLQWFDKYLKGMDTGVEKLPTVTQYVIGYGENGAARYAVTTDWPHPLAVPQRLYLHGDMTLSDQLPASGEATHTVSEPAAPEMTVSTNSDGTLLVLKGTPADGSECSVSYEQWTLGLVTSRPCYSDDTQVENTQKALEYETPALTENLYFNGPIEADIWLSSTVTSAAVSVRVDDVGPDGTATPISNGLLSAVHRAVDNSRSRYLQGVMIQPWHPFTQDAELPITPGEPMLLPVEIFPNAALIRVGHKLRVAVSASDQAQGLWSRPEQTVAEGGVSTIYNDPDHPSSIVLPVVPASELSP
jgi:putative CocE/NonD family hydrolase